MASKIYALGVIQKLFGCRFGGIATLETAAYLDSAPALGGRGFADLVLGRYWIDVYAGAGCQRYLPLRPSRGPDTDPIPSGAKVYITGRRMDAIENAAKTHSPSDGGQIIPYACSN